MAIYRNIQMSFWTDPKVLDSFTPEDKYFYLYLMTNPHTNLCGCYEISERQIENETGYTKKIIEKLIDRMCMVHKVIDFSKPTKEILITNWHKYNWTKSEKFRVPLLKEIQGVKNARFRTYLSDLANGIDTVSIPYQYGMDTTSIDTTVTDTVTDNNINTSFINTNNSNSDAKSVHGEYKHVLLTKDQFEKLVSDFGEKETLDAIKFLDEYIEMKGYKAKNHNLALRKWVFNAVKEEKQKGNRSNSQNFQPSTKQNKFSAGMETRGYDFAQLEKEAFGE